MLSTDLPMVIKRKLEDAYSVPVEILSLIEGPQALHFQVVRKQAIGSAIGFDVIVRQRQIEMFMMWNKPLISSVLPELWKAELIKSQHVFHVFWSQLQQNKVALSLVINGNDLPIDQALSPDLKWTSVDIKAILSSVAIRDSHNHLTDRAIHLVTLYWGLVLSLTGVDEKLQDYCFDGKESVREVTVYERNPINRKACIALKGTSCAVCGMDFEEKYGDIGAGFIEVHHIKPVSSYDGSVIIDPATDLVPVCSNCHSMLHRRNPPYSVEELREKIKAQALH